MKKNPRLSFTHSERVRGLHGIFWLWPVALFMGMTLLAFFTSRAIDDEFLALNRTLRVVESANRKSYDLMYLMIQMEQNQGDSTESIRQFKELLSSLEKDLNEVSHSSSQGVLFSQSFRSMYFNDEWRFDEMMSHYLLLTHQWFKTYLKLEKTSNTVFAKEMTKHHQNFHKIESILIPLVEQEVSRVQSYARWFKLAVLAFYAVSLSLLYLVVYRPMREALKYAREDLNFFKVANDHLEGRGDVYYWELDLADMSITRSPLMSGLLEGSTKERKLSLDDEIKLFKYEDRESFLIILDKAIAQRESFAIEVNVVAKNGTEYWFHYQLNYDESAGKRFVGTVKNISSIKTLEAQFRQTFSHTPIPLILLRDDHIKHINAKAVELLALKDDHQLIDNYFSVLFPHREEGDHSVVKLETLCQQVNKRHKISRGTVLLKHGDKEYIKASVEVFSLPFREGHSYMISIVDDSKRLHLERRLLDVNRNRLYERKRNVELIAHYHTLLHDVFDKVKELNIDDEYFSSLHENVNRLWQDSLSFEVTHAQHLTLVEDYSFSFDLEKTIQRQFYSRSRRIRIRFDSINRDHVQYYWLDVEKVRTFVCSFLNLVLDLNGEKDHHLTIHLDFQMVTQKLSKFKVALIEHAGRCDFSNREVKARPLFRTICNIAEYLQGELKQSRDDRGSLTTILSFDVERSANSMVVENELILAGEREERMDTRFQEISESDLWEHLGIEPQLIRTLLRDFINFYPICIADMLESIRDQDGETLYRYATDLYALVGYFPYFNCIESIVLIKKYAQFNKFYQAEQELETLMTELKKLERSVDYILLNMDEVSAA